MTPTLVLLNILGGVCLLLWGLNNVRKSIQRAFGHHLQQFLSSWTRNRFQALASGMGITFLLQSSTATALITAALCANGMITTASGVALMLGADIATSLLAFIFSLNIEWLAPLFLMAGYILHRYYQKAGRKKYLGQLLLSLGIMLFSLGWLQQSIGPLKDSDILMQMMAALGQDAIMSILIAAALTWLAHSSLAIVLLLISFTSAGLLPLATGVMMIFGANLGGAIAPIMATLNDKAKARRVPVSNFIMRLTGVIIAAPLVHYFLASVQMLDFSDVSLLVAAHISFNVFLMILFLPFIHLIDKFSTRLVPDRALENDPSRPQYLDAKQLDTPNIALTSASRETLRMADIVQSMLGDTITALGNNDEAMTLNIRQRDDTIDRLYKAIKLYLAKLSEESLDPDESREYLRIMSFCINLESVGDIIDKSLMDMSLKKINKKQFFSDKGWKDIKEIHNFVLQTMNNAQTVFLNENSSLARDIIKGKDWIRGAEARATEAHLERIREGVPETIATSSLHLDIIRDYRRINSYISTVAYPILEDTGELTDKRLKKAKS